MADLDFIEKESELIIAVDKKIVGKEAVIMEQNLKTASQIFKIRVVDFVETMKARDLSEEQIINILLDDFNNDGTLFGGFKRSLFGASDSFVGNVETNEVAKEFTLEGYEENETWVAVLINTCPDCLPRHGKTNSHKQWTILGLPRSGFSVCKGSCQCTLLPASVVGSTAELQEPLKRVKAEIKKIAKEKDVKNITNYVNRKLGTIYNTKDPIRSKIRKFLPGFKK